MIVINDVKIVDVNYLVLVIRFCFVYEVIVVYVGIIVDKMNFFECVDSCISGMIYGVWVWDIVFYCCNVIECRYFWGGCIKNWGFDIGYYYFYIF